MLLRVIHLFIALLFSPTLFSQNAGGWENAFRQWMDEEDIETTSIEEVYDILSVYADNPLNLNQATREELEQLPFLTPQQVEQLLAYVDRYGPMRSMGELQMLTALDAERRQLLRYFTYLGEAKPRDSRLRLDSAFLHGNHQLMLTGKIPLYERRGFHDGYLGSRYRHSMRYQLNYHDRVKWGVTGANDAGEPFLSGRNKTGYDHYSYYLQLKELGMTENLCLGMYRVQMGMGLLMNGGFYLGKLAILQSMGRSGVTLRPHSSRSTQGYLQGVAATFRLHRNWQLTAFASYRPLDATLNKDSTARTLLTSSYHRTKTEMGKKNNTHETDLGGSIGWRKGTLYAHANILYTHFDRTLVPQKESMPYRLYAAEGNDFMNMSLDYGYTNARLSFSGETAVNRTGAFAAIHQFNYRVNRYLNALLLHRYYDKRYTAHHAQSFCEGSTIQNEHGAYVGMTWQPSSKFSLNWYADYAHFPYVRYQVSLPSDAFDTMILVRTLLYKGWKLEGRYRLHIRQKDNDDKTWLINRKEHRVRLRLSHETRFGLSLQTQVDGIYVDYHQYDKGWLLSQQAVYQRQWFQCTGSFAYFHTDNYESRLYLYERPMLYEYSSLMLYGKGIRYMLMSRADIGKHLMVTAKIGVTNYFDRSKISSSYQEINGSSMADVDVQIRWKF
ncbi:MAG: helix-hairpin-helix domain-containing protein [Prevotella sp.]|nr:helix-hairpin-helix domain-containing protein [Prevotella sp.]